MNAATRWVGHVDTPNPSSRLPWPPRRRMAVAGALGACPCIRDWGRPTPDQIAHRVGRENLEKWGGPAKIRYPCRWGFAAGDRSPSMTRFVLLCCIGAAIAGPSHAGEPPPTLRAGFGETDITPNVG